MVVPTLTSPAESSTELSAPTSGVVGVLRRAMPREEFFAGLYILGLINGLSGQIIQSINLDGWSARAFDRISVIEFLACFAGVSLLLRERKEAVRTLDLAFAAIFLLFIILPVGVLSWVGVTGLSLYILLTQPSPSIRRGAIILLAVTVPILWSRLLFQFFANIILGIDAALVASVLGTDRVGNVVRFFDSSGYMVVQPGCSSLANMSLAFLCWVTVTQWVNHRWSPTDIIWCLLTCVSVIAVNVVRISLMGLSQDHYQTLHTEFGATIANFILLALSVGFSVLGARREIFSRA
jgi:exosortase/archaeosortase family protein